jgi:heptosyltransferase-1
LPALTDAAKVYPHIQFDWVVEETFQSVPHWHQHVNQVIPVALRRWRKNVVSAFFKGEIFTFIRNLRQKKYDKIIDAQGLSKSALLAFFARGKRFGFDWTSARDPWASLWYHERAQASWEEHAVSRVRRLFAKSLGYPVPVDMPDYGIHLSKLPAVSDSAPYLVFLHGTTWSTKHWPEQYWVELARKAENSGFKIKLLWGNLTEKARADRIATEVSAAEVLPKLGLEEAASILSKAQAVVSVDTGLGHLAAALNVKTVSLYGPSDPILTGTYGLNQTHLKVNFACSPCFKRECQYPGASEYTVQPPCFTTLPPETVWRALWQQ